MRTAPDLERAARAAGCRVVQSGPWDGQIAAIVDCGVGGVDERTASWRSAAMLGELAKQAPGDRVVRVAVAIREIAGDDDGMAARMIHQWVQDRVEFVREDQETFAGPEWLLAEVGRWGTAQGDCDCHAQLVFAIASAARLHVELVVLTGEGDMPAHAVTRIGGAWAETTLAKWGGAALGEHPVAAKNRLGVGGRGDIERGREVVVGEKDVESKVEIDGVDALDGATVASEAAEASPSPPVTALTRDVNDEDLDAIVREFVAEGIDPRAALAVLFSESSLRPGALNAMGYAGINQMGRAELAGFGLSTAQWIGMSVAQQVPVVRRFWRGRRETLAREHGAAMRDLIYADAAHLYAANFLPERLKAVPETNYPLTQVGDRFYAANAIMDRDGNGTITIDDMAAWIVVRQTDARLGSPRRWAELSARFEAAIGRGGRSAPSVATAASAVVAGLVVGAIGAAAVWLAG